MILQNKFEHASASVLWELELGLIVILQNTSSKHYALAIAAARSRLLGSPSPWCITVTMIELELGSSST